MTDGDATGSGDNAWDPEQYEDHHGYVADYGEAIVDLLDPEDGETVLDLGCGPGHLTASIAERGADVVGVDASQEMIEAARERYPALRFMAADARSLASDVEARDAFDAVFSNAALHWIPDQDHDAVLDNVREVLRPGGRFVAEMGGRGNVAALIEALNDALVEQGHAPEPGSDGQHPWYFPSIGEYAPRLEEHGLEIRYARLIDRPTAIEGEDGLRSWFDSFGDAFFEGVPDDDRVAALDAVEDRLREERWDADAAEWTVDYRRLRFVAVRDDGMVD